MTKVGDRIQEARQRRRMTQEALAEQSGLSKGFISDVENNNKDITSKNLQKIAQALKVSVDYLMTGAGSQRSPSKEEAVVIPPELSMAAQELGLTYGQTLQLLEAHAAVVARRGGPVHKKLTVEDWKQLWSALEEVFG